MNRDERMPEAQLYEEEMRYMPYRESVNKVVETICREADKASAGYWQRALDSLKRRMQK